MSGCDFDRDRLRAPILDRNRLAVKVLSYGRSPHSTAYDPAVVPSIRASLVERRRVDFEAVDLEGFEIGVQNRSEIFASSR